MKWYYIPLLVLVLIFILILVRIVTIIAIIIVAFITIKLVIWHSRLRKECSKWKGQR